MITSLYLGILGVLYFIISLETIKARGREKVSLGVGDKNQLLYLVSAHSNFASYTPIFIIMFFLVEFSQGSPSFLHLIGVSFVMGRLLHFLTMRNEEKTFKKRKLAMQLTLWPLLLLSFFNCYLSAISLLK